MPSDTKKIDIKILEYNDPNNILGQTSIKDPNTTGEIKVNFGDPNDPNTSPIPAVKVKIKAEAYGATEQEPLSIAEEEREIIVGQNTVNLNLGKYELTLSATPKSIIPDIDPNSTLNQTTITATLEISYPTPTINPDPNVTPKPPTTPMPVKDKEIKFTMKSGTGSLSANSGTTDPNGQCKVTLTWDKTSEDYGDMEVEATFQTDPNTTPLTKTVIVGVSSSLLWQDDFESYPLYSWPSAWTGDGNASDSSTNGIEDLLSYDGITTTQTLRLHGQTTFMGGALAHSLIQGLNPPYEIRLKLYPYNDPLSGDAHKFRGRVAVSSGAGWWYSNLTLLKFSYSGTIYAGWDVIPLRSYNTKKWYSIKVQCLTSSVNYWIKEEPNGPVTISTWRGISAENNPYLTIESGGGSSYFDKIQIYSLKESIFSGAININSGNSWNYESRVGQVVQQFYDIDNR